MNDLDNLYFVTEDGTELSAVTPEIEIKTAKTERPIEFHELPDEYHGSFEIDIKVPKCFISYEKYLECEYFNRLMNYSDENIN